MAGYRILPTSEIPKELAGFDTIWTGNGLFGALKIIPQIPGVGLAEITSTLVAYDNKGCSGEFASGIRSLTESALRAAQAVFTTCRSPEEEISVYYTVFPRSAGGFYNLALVRGEENERF